MNMPKEGSFEYDFLKECNFLLSMDNYDIYRKDLEHTTGIIIYKDSGSIGAYPLDQIAMDVIVHAIDEFKNSNNDSDRRYWKNEIDLRIKDTSPEFHL